MKLIKHAYQVVCTCRDSGEPFTFVVIVSERDVNLVSNAASKHLSLQYPDFVESRYLGETTLGDDLKSEAREKGREIQELNGKIEQAKDCLSEIDLKTDRDSWPALGNIGQKRWLEVRAEFVKINKSIDEAKKFVRGW
jgi:hypothetical protein